MKTITFLIGLYFRMKRHFNFMELTIDTIADIGVENPLNERFSYSVSSEVKYMGGNIRKYNYRTIFLE